MKQRSKGDIQEAGQKARTYAALTTKEDLLDRLADQFDQTVQFFREASKRAYRTTYQFGSSDDPLVRDYFTVAMLLRDHIAHHRARLIVYLRMKGLEPVPYRGF